MGGEVSRQSESAQQSPCAGSLQKNTRVYPCMWCKTLCKNFDMLSHKDRNGKMGLFCSVCCTTSYKVKQAGLTGIRTPGFAPSDSCCAWGEGAAKPLGEGKAKPVVRTPPRQLAPRGGVLSWLSLEPSPEGRLHLPALPHAIPLSPGPVRPCSFCRKSLSEPCYYNKNKQVVYQFCSPSCWTKFQVHTEALPPSQ